LACLPGLPESSAALEVLRKAGVPNHSFPADAVQVLAGLLHLRELRERPDQLAPRFRARKKLARGVVEGALGQGREILDGQEMMTVLNAYGIPVVPSALVNRRELALKAVNRLGFPMVAKVASEKILHKSDRGGVLVDLRNREELLAAYVTLEDRFLGDDPNMQVMLQAMRSDGVETFFGVATDPLLGRMLAFGLGGIHVEILKDVVFRLHPLKTLLNR
jgi:acyl-CoA synthetase (NDP forming)